MSGQSEKFQNEIDVLLHNYVHEKELIDWIGEEQSARQIMNQSIIDSDLHYRQQLSQIEDQYKQKINAIYEEKNIRLTNIHQKYYHLHKSIAKELREQLEIAVQTFDKEQRNIIEKWLGLQLSKIEQAKQKCNYNIVDINYHRQISSKQFHDDIATINEASLVKRINTKEAHKIRIKGIKKDFADLEIKCEKDNSDIHQYIWEDYLKKQSEACDWIKGKASSVYESLCLELGTVSTREKEIISELVSQIKANLLDDNKLANALDIPASLSSKIRKDYIQESQTEWIVGLNHYLIMVSRINTDFTVLMDDVTRKHENNRKANAELKLQRIKEANDDLHQALKNIGDWEASEIDEKRVKLGIVLDGDLSQIIDSIQQFRKELVFPPPNNIPNLHELRDSLSKFSQFITGNMKMMDEEDMLSKEIIEALNREETSHTEALLKIENEWLQQKEFALKEYQNTLTSRQLLPDLSGGL